MVIESYHLALTYLKKLSPGRNVVSIPVILTTFFSGGLEHPTKVRIAMKRMSNFFMDCWFLLKWIDESFIFSTTRYKLGFEICWFLLELKSGVKVLFYPTRSIFSILRPLANSSTNLSKYLTCWVNWFS